MCSTHHLEIVLAQIQNLIIFVTLKIQVCFVD